MVVMWLHAPYSQLEYRSRRNQWVWPDWTAKGQTDNIETLTRRQKTLTWDITVMSILANSYLSSSAQSAGAAADLAASRKEAKYTSLTNSYIFSANRSGIPQCVQCKCPLLPRHFGRTLDWYLRPPATSPRDVIFIPKTLGHCTTFQFCLKTRELCFCRWRTGL